MQSHRFTIVVATAITCLVVIALLLQYDSVLVFRAQTRTSVADGHRRNAAVIHKNTVHVLNSIRSSSSSNTTSTAIATTTTTLSPSSSSSSSSSTRLRHRRHTTASGNANHDDVDNFLLSRSSGGADNNMKRKKILLIPVNTGYLDFGLNLLCSLKKVASSSAPRRTEVEHLVDFGQEAEEEEEDGGAVTGTGYTFVAMDQGAEERLRMMGLPVFRDPDMPFVSSKSAEWADPKFHKLVCTKLFPVLRALKKNLTVVLSDADIVFRRDPSKYLFRDGLDMIFSIGSCHRDLPDNYDLQAGDGLAKLNTGFYSVSPGLSSPASSPLIDLFSKALSRCMHSNQLEGDQPAMNAVLQEDLDRHHHARDQQHQGVAAAAAARGRTSSSAASGGAGGRVRYGFFDGCLFANGCIYFKHLCANSTSLDPASREAAALLRNGKKMPHHKLSSPSAAAAAAALLPPGHNVRRDDPVLVHANFLVGKKDKIQHLKKAGLWYEDCIAKWKKRRVH